MWLYDSMRLSISVWVVFVSAIHLPGIVNTYKQGCSVRGSAKSSGSRTFTHFNEFEKCRSEFDQSSTNFQT